MGLHISHGCLPPGVLSVWLGRWEVEKPRPQVHHTPHLTSLPLFFFAFFPLPFLFFPVYFYFFPSKYSPCMMICLLRNVTWGTRVALKRARRPLTRILHTPSIHPVPALDTLVVKERSWLEQSRMSRYTLQLMYKAQHCQALIAQLGERQTEV